jgi:archaemetzincin
VGLLQETASALERAIRATCTIANEEFDPSFAHHAERNQYHSTLILEELERQRLGRWPIAPLLLAVTGLDLYIPILTFVFGEAHVGGACALVSYHRLTQEFYGLPRDRRVLTDRLIKEAVHEVGHTAGLHHCEDYECVMAPSHAVEWVDMKRRTFCSECASRLDVRQPSIARTRS